MNRQDFLKLVSKEIYFIFDRKSIEKELDEHISDSVEDLKEEGFCKEDAERIAVEQMGDPVETGKALNREHHPVLGYLWLISKIVLILLMIPTIYYVILGLWSGAEILFPANHDKSEIVCPLDIKHETSTMHLKLDDLIQNERGDYFITYRARWKYSYSRTVNMSSQIFEIVTSDGESNMGAGSCSLSGLGTAKGSQSFVWPEDNLIYVVDRDGERIEIDLEEYGNETK